MPSHPKEAGPNQNFWDHVCNDNQILRVDQTTCEKIFTESAANANA